MPVENELHRIIAEQDAVIDAQRGLLEATYHRLQLLRADGSLPQPLLSLLPQYDEMMDGDEVDLEGT